MATDGPDPPRCDPEIYRNGHGVFMTSTIPSNAMEGWVRRFAALSGQPVDWHFLGGRAVVLALGDLARVREAIETLLPQHDELFLAACESLGIKRYAPVPHRWLSEDQ